MVGLPNILFQVGEEMLFFFDENATTLFEGDILVNSKLVPTLLDFIKTLEYEGSQPEQTPKTGDIQAPSIVGIIIPPFTVSLTGTGTATIKIRFSDTADTADGTIVFDFDLATGETFTTFRTIVLPANKFFTIDVDALTGSPFTGIDSFKTIERGINTRDLDPLLQ